MRAEVLTSIFATGFAVLFLLIFAAWRRYVWVAEETPHAETDTCQYSLRDVFGAQQFVNVPHQKGIRWLTEVFSRSAERFPHLTALQVPHTGESLTFAELDARAENVAAALSPFLTGPDQVVAVAMSQATGRSWPLISASSRPAVP
jgi:non-ribosomal peptide synthetase component F